jgi:hypothetical protein
MATQQHDIEAVFEELLNIFDQRNSSFLSAGEIEEMIRRHPEVLTRTSYIGWTLLQYACSFFGSYRASPSTIRLMVDLCPRAARMPTSHVRVTPLHLACQNGICMETISILIDAYFEALTDTDNAGDTPLHASFRSGGVLPEVLLLLLSRCPVAVLGMCNAAGRTPLHEACYSGVSLDILRQTIHLYPKALRMMDGDGRSPHYLVCLSGRNLPLEVIQVLTHERPESCLLLDRYNFSPYDRAVQSGRQDQVQEFLQEATHDAVIALLEYVFCIYRYGTIPSAVRAHAQAFLTNFVPELRGNARPGRLLVQSVRPHLNLSTLRSLLRNSHLQDLLKNEKYQQHQDLVRGVVRINKSVREEGNKVQGVCGMESIADTPACLFLLLRNNPSLCWREDSTATTASRNEAVLPPHNEVPGE